MADARKWSNVAVALGAIGSSTQTITGITQAAPGVVTTSGTAPADGSLVFFDVQGMTQINESVFRTMGLSGSTFQLEDVDGTPLDTTGFDAFVSGTFVVVTLSTSITTATTISPSGGEFDQIDITTIHDTLRKTIPGLPAAMSYGMDHIWDVADAGLQALNAAYKTNARQVVSFTFGTGGPKMLFAGYVGATLLPGGQSQGLVTTSATFTVSGFPTYLAS